MATFVFMIGGEDSELYTISDGIERAKKEIPLDEVIKWAEADPIWANRGKAIQGYAQLENALCSIMAEFGGFSRETAMTIFFKISSADSRNKILEKLLHAKHSNRFNLFWNSYFKELKQIDRKRNKIVHWLAAANATLGDKNILFVGVTLIHTASVSSRGAGVSSMITSKNLIAFEKKCDEFARLATMFLEATRASHGASPDTMKPWLDIFHQPLVYPLPEDHLLFQKPQASDTPLQS